MRYDYSDTTVIIPTLNEKGNIEKVIGALARRYGGIHIIISDDGSRDGTIEAVRGLGRRNERITLLDRSRKRIHGLTASVLDAAMTVGTANIVVMDGDLQHPPEKVGSIARALGKYDIVVGVRTRVKSWGMHRRIMSKGMTCIANAALSLGNKKSCNDVMSGFFGVRAALLKGMIASDRNRFVEGGYKILLDILKNADKDQTIGEVYYSTFHLRKEGRSKFGFRHMITTLRSALR